MPGPPYKLLNANGETYLNDTPGEFGGYRRKGNTFLYGRLDCPNARRHVANGHYVEHRVFFADQATAIAAGHIPCSICMKEERKRWAEQNPEKAAELKRKQRKG